MSKFYKINCCYEELSSDALPWSITDLIEIDGIRLIQSEDSRNHSFLLKVIHNSAKGAIIKRLGHEDVKRLKPKSTVAKTTIDSMSLGAHCTGVHMRTTGSVHANHSSSGPKDTTERMIQVINNLSALNGYSHAYLACDSLEARDTWSDIIAVNTDLQVIHNSASFDRYQLRQSSHPIRSLI